MIKSDGVVEPAQSEVNKLLNDVQQEFPGVIEIVKAYGDYEETISLIQQYLEIDKGQPQITTSNHSCPVTIGQIYAYLGRVTHANCNPASTG